MLEKDIQNSIIQYLKLKGWFVLRVNSGMAKVETKKGSHMIRLAPAGTPDLIACSPEGRFFGIEVKRPGNKPTQAQRCTLREINDLGGVGMWVTSLEELIEDIETTKSLDQGQGKV